MTITLHNRDGQTVFPAFVYVRLKDHKLVPTFYAVYLEAEVQGRAFCRQVRLDTEVLTEQRYFDESEAFKLEIQQELAK